MAEDNRMDEGMEMGDEQLDAVAGGFLYNNGTAWELIGMYGNVIEVLPEGTTWREARKIAISRGQHPFELTWAELERMRIEFGNQ